MDRYDPLLVSRIDDMFEGLRARNRCGLMPFVTAGYPSLEATEDALAGMEAAGADAVEVGIPYSDPIADGPIIAASMHESLCLGVTPREILDMTSRIAADVRMPLIAMVSYSIVHQMGGRTFLREAAAAGFSGFILPDADVSHVGPLAEEATACGTTLTMLVAPTTSIERARVIANSCSGFVYVLARVGLTGERRELPDVSRRLDALRSVSSLPLAVGFGISSADQVSAAARHADAVIVGSALVRRMGTATDPAAAAVEFVSELSKARCFEHE